MNGNSPIRTRQRSWNSDSFSFPPITADWDASWPAPAKINLFLHIVGQRDNGYHELETIFRFVDYGDELTFSPLDSPMIELTYSLPGVEVEKDLCYRAARLLQQKTNYSHGVRISLHKRLPMGGGLGGGSSDAATALVALNFLWKTGLDRSELQKIGLELGADVPVFIHGHSTLARGIGDVFSPPPPNTLSSCWYLIIKPPVEVPTPLIFRDPNLCRNTPRLSREPRPSDLDFSITRNDMEDVAMRLFPSISEARNWLVQACPKGTQIRMTGSGACLFAAFEHEADARHVLAMAPYAGFVGHSLDRHPLVQLG